MDYIKKARDKHGDKFDYSKFEYKNAKTKSIIICPEHGEFEQNMDRHLNSKFACWECNLKYKDKRDVHSGCTLGDDGKFSRPDYWIDLEELKSRVREKFGGDIDFDIKKFRGFRDSEVIVRCDIHGETSKNMETLLQCKYPCTKCSVDGRIKSKTKDYDHMVQKCMAIHGDSYKYPDDNRLIYQNSRSKIKIICLKHGEFTKSLMKHLSGQGCFGCKVEKLILDGTLKGGYSEKYFEDNPDEKLVVGYLYYIKVGSVYKIGITKNLEQRLRTIKCVSKRDVEIISIFTGPLHDAYMREQTILKEFEEYRTFRKWSSEVFYKDIYENIKQYLED